MSTKVFLIVFFILVAFAAFEVSKAIECSESGGTTVRGFWGWECIDGGCK